MARLGRRAVLLGGLSGLIAGCGASPPPAPAGTQTPPPAPTTTPASVEPQFAALEKAFGGRLGVCALDTGNGATVGYRGGERFLMCSTHKVLVVAAVLRLRTTQPGLLERVIHYDRSQLQKYAPVTSQHVADGMSVSDLCHASITQSDNTAANLLTGLAGGPAAATAFVRTLGDPLTRLDRLEPDLNVTTPGDERDTTTPDRIAADLAALAVGGALDPAGRDLLDGWLAASVTGAKLVRAGVPDGWQVGDKSGTGSQGETNDVAVVRPPGRAPLVFAVYTAPTDPASKAGPATIAQAAAIAAKVLVPG